jgi:hypothetical protein
MRFTGILIIITLAFFPARAQGNLSRVRLPVFKEVTHPFIPPITSQSFFFSDDGLIWFSTARGLTSFDGPELVYHSTLEEANTFGLNRVNDIAEDKNHNFYIAGGKILFFNRVKQTYTAIKNVSNDTNKIPLKDPYIIQH